MKLSSSTLTISCFLPCFQDETPLFLAAREGSYETAKTLLDHYANREITDHMDRLPRDAAAERMHQDILHLLDEYRLNSPNDITLPNGLPTSPNGYPPFMHPQNKSKQKQRRTKNNGQINMKDILSYPNGTKPNGLPQKKQKPKRKSAAVPRNGHSQNRDSSVGTLSPGDSIESPNGYDMTPPTYDNVCGQGQQIMMHPSQLNGIDEHAVTCALQNGMDEQHVMNNHYKGDLRLDQHPGMEMLTNEWLHSQQQQQHQQQLAARSPMNVTNSIPTPPSSNPSHNNGSPGNHEGKPSPVKGKTGFPTSPPHYLAMQQHAQRNRPQKSPHHYHIDSYPFSNENHNMDTNIPQYTVIYENQQQRVSTPMQVPHIPQYPTPPSQHSYLGSDSTPPNGLALPDNILTPSPDSPGHWSSSSPHSAQSDWSEGISSPVPPIGHVNKGRNQLPNEAVYI